MTVPSEGTLAAQDILPTYFCRRFPPRLSKESGTAKKARRNSGKHIGAHILELRKSSTLRYLSDLLNAFILLQHCFWPKNEKKDF